MPNGNKGQVETIFFNSKAVDYGHSHSCFDHSQGRYGFDCFVSDIWIETVS